MIIFAAFALRCVGLLSCYFGSSVEDFVRCVICIIIGVEIFSEVLVFLWRNWRVSFSLLIESSFIKQKCLEVFMYFIPMIVAAVGFSCFGFDVPKDEAVISVSEEWQCSNCKWHNYAGTIKCYYCGTAK